jgi:hypothetical protein
MCGTSSADIVNHFSSCTTCTASETGASTVNNIAVATQVYDSWCAGVYTKPTGVSNRKYILMRAVAPNLEKA